MKSAGWKVVDSGPDTRIAEFKVDNPHDTLLSYEEAKAAALQRLREHVAPYLARIDELEQDVFAEAGALPPLKAWRCHYGFRAVVTAKTKKRAAELAEESLLFVAWHQALFVRQKPNLVEMNGLRLGRIELAGAPLPCPPTSVGTRQRE